MKRQSRLITLSACISVLFFVFLNGCHSFFSSPADANTIHFRGPLTIALHEDIYLKSLEKDLMVQFAKTYSFPIHFIPFKTINQAETFLTLEKADIVLTRMPTQDYNFAGTYSWAYDDLKISVVCAGDFKQAKDLFIPNHYFSVTQNENFYNQFRRLNWTKSNSTNHVLNKQALKQNGFCYLSDHRLAKKTVMLSSELKIVWTTKKAVPVAWVTRKDLPELNRLVQFWFQNLVRQNQIRKFWDPYEKFEFIMTNIATKRFDKDIQETLPAWRNLFEKHASKNQIPWTLLAAVAYQESKWDNSAISYTGVRGLMQITTSTAEHLGIENRSDPEQSIEGGAFYLKYLYKKTPKNLSAYERWAQALAAYNMGWAHIRDARGLAKNLNTDSNRWLKFKKILPLLSQEKYYRELPLGPARGDETVEFVDQVFGYTEYLNAAFTQQSQTSQDF